MARHLLRRRRPATPDLALGQHVLNLCAGQLLLIVDDVNCGLFGGGCASIDTDVTRDAIGWLHIGRDHPTRFILQSPAQGRGPASRRYGPAQRHLSRTPLEPRGKPKVTKLRKKAATRRWPVGCRKFPPSYELTGCDWPR